MHKYVNLKNSIILVVFLLIVLGISWLLSYNNKQVKLIEEASEIVASSANSEEKIQALKNIAASYSRESSRLNLSVSLAYDKTECQQLFGYWFTHREDDVKLADLLWDVMKSKNCPLD